MKIRKTMTERALRANRENGKKNPGPKNTERTKLNAVTHALLAKKLVFENDEDKQRYNDLLAEHVQYHSPVGPAETTQVSVIGISLWRLGDLYGWESTEIRNRKEASAAFLESLSLNSDAQQLQPLFSATQQTWQPVELLVSNGTRCEDEGSGFKPDNTKHLTVQAKLTSSLDTIMRYKAALLRDYYRALATLQELQRQRLELDGLQPGGGEVSHEEN